MAIERRPDRNVVGYAIDLLRAHQIRRENVFLHEQLKTCLKEVVSLRHEVEDLRTNQITAVNEEIKYIKASVDTSNGTAQQAFARTEKHESRLDGHAQELGVIQQSCSVLQTGFSNLRDSCVTAQEGAQARMITMHKQLQVVSEIQGQASAAQDQQAQRILEAIQIVQRNLDGKADAATVGALDNRLAGFGNHAPLPTHNLDAISHVSDTFGDLGQPGKLRPDSVPTDCITDHLL